MILPWIFFTSTFFKKIYCSCCVPDTNLLILIGQVDSIAIVEVVRLNGVNLGSIEVLHATLRGQVVWVARELGNLLNKNTHFDHWYLQLLTLYSIGYCLNGPLPAGNSSSNTSVSKGKAQLVTALTASLNIHWKEKIFLQWSYTTFITLVLTVFSGVGSTNGGRVGTLRVADTEGVGQALAKVWDTDTLRCLGSDVTPIGPPLGDSVSVGAGAGDDKGVKVQPHLQNFIHALH